MITRRELLGLIPGVLIPESGVRQPADLVELNRIGIEFLNWLIQERVRLRPIDEFEALAPMLQLIRTKELLEWEQGGYVNNVVDEVIDKIRDDFIDLRAYMLMNKLHSINLEAFGMKGRIEFKRAQRVGDCSVHINA